MADEAYNPTKEDLEHWAYIESLPISVRYPIRRKASLERCLRLRRLLRYPERIAAGYEPGHVWAWLKREQTLLFKLRIWRSTGHYPAEN